MSNQARVKVLLNNEWKFMHGDFENVQLASFQDENWYDVGLPHSFGIPYFMENEFYVGYGCYRKWLDIPTEWLGKRLSLEFQGVFQVAEVYVNGVLAGEHRGGYTAFCVDVTKHVHAGRNLIAVRVNNEWSPVIAPRAGEHMFQGGIYRDVSLIVMDPVHVAWYGTYVTAPKVSAERAELLVQTEVENEASAACKIEVESRILFDGELLTVRQTDCALAAGEKKTLQEREIVIDQPRLWCPETPHMYTLETIVYCNGKVYDRVETPFGIRSIRFDAKEGFFLNGSHYFIQGANAHQDHAGWSDAVTCAGLRRDVQMIKECGMNFIRGSHYPHHTAFAEACDQVGLLFWSEMCFWGVGGAVHEGYWTSSAYPIHEEDQLPFEESCIAGLREMIRTNRNHPSIIAWSMCNEVFFCDASVTDKAKNLLRRMVEVSHEEDPSRPAAVGGVQRGGFDQIGDLAGYNGDGASLFIDPGIPNLVSEYGSHISQRPGTFEPHYTDNTAQIFPWRSGRAIWCGFHHGSILDDMGAMGMIDYSRLPTRSWYWYREKLRGIPAAPESVAGEPAMITLDSDRNTISTNGTEDCQLVVRLLNEKGERVKAECEVLVEIVSGDGRLPTGRTMILTPEKHTFHDGMGAVEMRAYYAGDIVVRATCGTLTCEKIIRAVGDTPWMNQPVKLPAPPPCVYGVPALRAQYDLALQRPVFGSDNIDRDAASAVVDGLVNTAWTASEPGWVMVDLEGNKAFNSVVVRTNSQGLEHISLSLSNDGKSFVPLAWSDVEEHRAVAQVEGKWRYVRVEAVKAGTAVQAVHCMVSKESER